MLKMLNIKLKKPLEVQSKLITPFVMRQARVRVEEVLTNNTTTTCVRLESLQCLYFFYEVQTLWVVPENKAIAT